MQKDLILGLLRTDVLQRVAFLLEKMSPRWRSDPSEDAAAINDLLRLLSTIGSHSRAAAQKIAHHRRLMRCLVPLCLAVNADAEVVATRKLLCLRLMRVLCHSSAALSRSLVSWALNLCCPRE